MFTEYDRPGKTSDKNTNSVRDGKNVFNNTFVTCVFETLRVNMCGCVHFLSWVLVNKYKILKADIKCYVGAIKSLPMICSKYSYQY